MLCLILVLTLSCVYGQIFPTSGPRSMTPPVCACPKPAVCPKPVVCPKPPACPSVTAEPEATTAAGGRPSILQETGGQNLRARTGFHLAVSDRGEVYGIRAVKGKGTGWDSDAVLKMKGRGGEEVQIRGVKAKLYIAMNAQGEVYAERDPNSFNTWWEQSQQGPWLRFRWLGNNLGWYLSLQRNGKTRNGNLTDTKQVAVQFKAEDPVSSGNATTPSAGPPVEHYLSNYDLGLDNVTMRSRTGYSLAVSRKWKGEPWLSASTVNVYAEKPNKITENHLFLISRPSPEERPRDVKIYSKMGVYVEMDQDGYVSLTEDWVGADNWWRMAFADDNTYVTYQWLGNNKNWYLSVTKRGGLRRGPDTSGKHNSAHFVPPWKTVHNARKRF